MGNCITRASSRERDSERSHANDRNESQHIGKQKAHRNSFGRLADFLSQQQSSFLGGLQDKVSAKLPTAAERGSREVVDLLKGPGYLDPVVWCAGLDVPVVKARATALEKAVDTLLIPLIKAMEVLLNGQASSDKTKENIQWQSAGLREFHSLLPHAAKMNSGVGLPALRLALSSIFKVLHALSQTACSSELPIVPEIFHIAAINRLMDMIGTLACRHVGESSSEEEQQRWQDWNLIAEALSLEEEKLVVSLGPQAKALLFWMHGGLSGRARVRFETRRGSVFNDAFLQAQCCDLLQCEKGGCSIEAAFIDAQGPDISSLEEGSSGHGPRKEFFFRAAQEIVQQDASMEMVSNADAARCHPPLFLYNRWAARFWFNTKLRISTELRAKYTFAGWLLGQALCNRTSLGVPFSELLFAKLLLGSNFKATVEVLQEHDIEAASAIRTTAALKEAEWKELLRQEGLDPATKRRTYIKFAAYRLLIQDVHWQFSAFAQGFFTAIDYKSILRWRLTPADLEAWASWGSERGTLSLPLQDQYRMVMDPDMLNRSPKLGSVVLEVVNSWSEELRAKFLAFVTGMPRPCHPKMEALKISMPFFAHTPEDLPCLLNMLPQAHTCDNVLEMPDYEAALCHSHSIGPVKENIEPSDLHARLLRLVDERLQTAVMHCCTYELPRKPCKGVKEIGCENAKDRTELQTISAVAIHRPQEHDLIWRLSSRGFESTKSACGAGHAAMQARSRRESKLGQPQQSASPLSCRDMIPAIRRNQG